MKIRHIYLPQKMYDSLRLCLFQTIRKQMSREQWVLALLPQAASRWCSTLGLNCNICVHCLCGKKKWFWNILAITNLLNTERIRRSLKNCWEHIFMGCVSVLLQKTKNKKKQRKKTCDTRDLSWEQLCGDNCSFQGSCSFMLYGKDRWHVARQKIQISPVKII